MFHCTGCNLPVRGDFHLAVFKLGKQRCSASFEAELAKVSEQLKLKTMAKLISILLILSFYGQGNCCGSLITRAITSPITAGLGAIGSIIGGISGAQDLNYPVDVYPSACRNGYYQVCTNISLEYF